MIDPDSVTQYNAPREWKEEFLLFCLCVAGKGAFQQARKLDAFLELLREECGAEGIAHYTPFQMMLHCGKPSIDAYLRRVKMGQYSRLGLAFAYVSQLNVDTCTVADLEAIPGIGPKTARFFIVHTRPDQRYSILDTHILAHLRGLRTEDGLPKYKGVPKSTPPSGRKYDLLESAALTEAYEAGMTPADWDLMVWKSRRKGEVHE